MKEIPLSTIKKILNELAGEKTLVKVTEFEGYVSGDGECFCLDVRSKEEKENQPIQERYGLNAEDMAKIWEENENNRLYPNDFFPEECAPLISDKREKFKFEIVVTATPIVNQKTKGGK